MQRRTFLKNTAFCAVAVSASGFIRFDGTGYTGDCETTTDIIGPNYRPNAPVRNDLVIPNGQGEIIELSGIIKHKDCTTPLKDACVEIWHCDAKGVYDNESDAFRYRGKACCDANGQYKFRTIFPIPYNIGGNNWRPAHYHLLISAPGYQELITQIYFTGDPHLSQDSSSSSPAAKRRILDIQKNAKGERSILFNVTMMENLPADLSAIKKLTGKYTDADEKKYKSELFEKDGLLWVKNDTPTGGDPLYYKGNNTFEMYGEPTSFHFEILADGGIKATVAYLDNKGEKKQAVAMKDK
ncbi:MAG: hypothetical protein ABI921_15240 [Panacibacter sp.]